MVQSRLFYNANGQAIGDVGRYKAHAQKVNPSALLLIDALALANELHAMLPGCIVIHRPYTPYGGDDDLVNRVSPEKWIDDRLNEHAPMIWNYCGNEQGFSEKVIDWYIRLIKYNASKPVPVRLVIGNFSVGTPEASDWKLADELLRLCDAHRDWLILGCHEYACGVITSGLYGGWPTHAGVDPHGIDKDKGLNLIPRDKWPENVVGITAFFMGRYHFLVDYCMNAKIRPPRMIMTEVGMDDVSAIKEWANTLPKTPPYDHIRGYKTLQRYWSEVYPQWGLEAAYFEALKWMDETIYKPLGIVEAELIFCWNQNGDWNDFDLSNASIFQKSLEEYAAKLTTAEHPVITPISPSEPAPKPVPPPLPAPVPVDPPSNRIDLQIALVKANNLRTDLDKAQADVLALIESIKTLLEIKPAA